MKYVHVPCALVVMETRSRYAYPMSISYIMLLILLITQYSWFWQTLNIMEMENANFTLFLKSIATKSVKNLSTASLFYNIDNYEDGFKIVLDDHIFTSLSSLFLPGVLVSEQRFNFFCNFHETLVLFNLNWYTQCYRIFVISFCCISFVLK